MNIEKYRDHFSFTVIKMAEEKVVKFLRDFPLEMFQSVRTEELCDVTLLGDDKLPVLAHRIMLASTSSFFRKLLSSQAQSEVVIHVEGLTRPDIETLLGFIYRDGTTATEGTNEDLARILDISKYLYMDFMEEKREGTSLPGPQDSQDRNSKIEKKNVLLSEDFEMSYFKTERPDYAHIAEDTEGEEELEEGETKPVMGSDLEDFDPELFEKCVENFEQQIPVVATENLLPHVRLEMKRMEDGGERYRRKRAKAGDKWIYNTYWSHEQELMINNSLETMVEEQDGRLMCKVCGRTKKRRTHMSAHLEIHLDSLKYICQYCGEVKRTSNAFRKHVNESHKVYVAEGINTNTVYPLC